MRRKSILIAAALTLCVGLAHADQTVDSVQKEVEGLWSKIKTFSAKITSDMTMVMGPATMKSHATGTLECERSADVSKFRMDMLNKMDTGIPGAGTTEQKMLSVFDGENMFTQMDMMGMTQAFKSSAAEAKKQGPLSGKSLFDGMRAQGDLKLLADSTVDGKAVYVVQVTPNAAVKASAPAKLSSMKYYISKETGLQVKMEYFDEANQPVQSTTYSDIKISIEFPKDHFVYKAPAGVTVMDAPGIPGAPAAK